MLGEIKIIQKLRQDLKELKAVEEKAQEIDKKLKKWIHGNKKIFSGLSVDQDDDAKQHVMWQEQEIIKEIQDLENNFNQLTQQNEDRQLVHLPNEQINEALGNTLIGLQEVAALAYQKNKNFSEYWKGIKKGDFNRKKTNWNNILFAAVLIGKGVIFVGDHLTSFYAKGLVKQYDEGKKKTGELLTRLRRKTEDYYHRFHRSPQESKHPYPQKSSDRGFILSFIGFLALLFALLFGLLVLI